MCVYVRNNQGKRWTALVDIDDIFDMTSAAFASSVNYIVQPDFMSVADFQFFLRNHCNHAVFVGRAVYSTSIVALCIRHLRFASSAPKVS
jgi:hypothetical protein